MLESLFSGYAPAICAINKSFLQQKRFVNIFNRFQFFRGRGGQCVQSDRAAAKFFYYGQQNFLVHLIEA